MTFWWDQQKIEDVLDEQAQVDNATDEEIFTKVKKWVGLVTETIQRNRARTILLTGVLVQIR